MDDWKEFGCVQCLRNYLLLDLVEKEDGKLKKKYKKWKK